MLVDATGNNDRRNYAPVETNELSGRSNQNQAVILLNKAIVIVTGVARRLPYV